MQNTVKYMGVVLEQCANMATSIIQKANARLKFLCRKRKFFNLTTEKLLVMSLIRGLVKNN